MTGRPVAARPAGVRGTMIRPSLRRTPETASVKESAGLPWGCVLQPLAPTAESGGDERDDAIGAEEVPRCEECFGYINAYCMFERKAWICCLCGCKNELAVRYSSSSARAGLPEMQRGIVDLLEECIEVDDVFAKELSPEHRPAFVAVIDVSGSEELVEVVRAGILALLEALPPSALFGLVTVASTVGVFDLRSALPHCYHVPIAEHEDQEQMTISDVLPAESMLVQIGTHKDEILAAVETISSASTPGAAGRKNGFGTCIDLLLDTFEATPEYSLRVMSVLGSMPNYGLGALTPPDVKASSAPAVDAAAASQVPPGGEAYLAMVERVKALAAVVDLFVIGEEGYVGVEACLPLAQVAGGTVVYYQGLDTAALPQDLYRIYSRPFASKGLLRLRCSSGFRVAQAFGHLTADDQFDHLLHVASCHSDSCFAVDLEFDAPAGVTTNLDVQPTLQLAFAYSCVVPVPDSTAYQVQRRLRIETLRVDMARIPLDLYATADSEVIASLLCHKILVSIHSHGLGEARLLLQDWLAILGWRYNSNMMRRREVTIDVSFTKHAPMALVPRLVYGLLRGRIMDPVRVSRDERAFLRHLCSSLDPACLSLMLYNKLQAWDGLDAPLNEGDDLAGGLPLSIQSLQGTGEGGSQGKGMVWLLDSYTELCVFYSKAAAEAYAFPPPPDSGLGSYIQSIKESRQLCPHVYHSKAGDVSSSDFYGRLIEDAAASMNVGGEAGGENQWAGAASQGYTTFLEVLRGEVKDFMSE